MNTQNEQALKPSREQIIYANLLIIGVWLGIFILVTTYVIYLTEILPSHVELTLIPKVWGKGVAEYLEITNSPHGWGWVGLLTKGDVNLETSARRLAEDAVAESALEDGILEQAGKNAEAYFSLLFRDLGYPEVIFVDKTPE